MRKPAAYLFAILVGALIWFFFQHFHIHGVDSIRVVPKEPGDPSKSGLNPLDGTTKFATKIFGGASVDTDSAPPKPDGTIRVSSFHLGFFGQTKLSKPAVVDIVARMVRRFDVVALQGIASTNEDLLPRLVEVVNQTGRAYDHIIGPRLGADGEEEQYAFVFDRQTVMTDRDELYTVGDPNNLLTREPLVAWFRTVGPAADQAFTFTLANISTDARRNEQELNSLDDVFYEVRDDGREEDDVIMLGNFNANDRELGELGQISGLVRAIRSVPTNVEATDQTENILFQRIATDEFTGRSGVFDFLRQYNLSVERAREISDFLPVWAEFAIVEGGDRGRVANRAEESAR